MKGEWAEDDHPRDDNGRFMSGGETADGSTNFGAPSPTGENTFKVRGFRSKQKLNNHWKDLSEEYADDLNITSKADYLERAQPTRIVRQRRWTR